MGFSCRFLIAGLLYSQSLAAQPSTSPDKETSIRPVQRPKPFSATTIRSVYLPVPSQESSVRPSHTLGRIVIRKIDGIVRIIAVDKSVKVISPEAPNSEIILGDIIEVIRGHLELKVDGYTFRSDRGAKFILEDNTGYPVARLLKGSAAIDSRDPNGERIGSRLPPLSAPMPGPAPESIPADVSPESSAFTGGSSPNPIQENRTGILQVVSPSAP